MIEVEQIKLEQNKSAERKSDGMTNEMSMEFDAISNNESFARVAVAAFIAPLNPTLEEMSDIKTAVSEAVTNAIIHGYENVYGYGRHGEVRPVCCRIREGKVYLRCRLENGVLHIEVEDKGVGMDNVDKAMEPLFTTKPELERSGMGFAFMEAFMDDVDVVSRRDIGTRITLKKFFSGPDYSAVCDGIADSKSDLHDEKSENDSECISGRNTIEQTHGIIKAIRPSINVQNINARTSD